MQIKYSISLVELKALALEEFRTEDKNIIAADIKAEYAGEYDSREFVGFKVERERGLIG
jgi:hypothetical protein